MQVAAQRSIAYMQKSAPSASGRLVASVSGFASSATKSSVVSVQFEPMLPLTIAENAFLALETIITITF